ncbi:hypothetical protein B0T25DRAFT_519356 [Lasiosphaeria hispida]|uniref:Uncharacterized protein n=1 Tax=Lasiosphaeria hispida TaxID=260671 RepID=A0AAJ0MBY5_9PEZI|nr:hypothetical protein B0T25DRAFT_519356 [Lasiosphaeria hispida]
MVRTVTEEDRTTKVWAKDGSPQIQDLCDTYSLAADQLLTHPVQGGFINGRALRQTCVTVTTTAYLQGSPCLFRVVHEGHPEHDISPNPHGGIKARGYGIRTTNPLFFQIDLQRHLNWTCREPSPFLSVTRCWEKMFNICARYHVRGFEGIKIHIIRPNAEAWAKHKTRM